MITLGDWMFVEKRAPEAGKKTDVWGIHNRRSGGFLGEIRWYGGWRSYCFFPVSATTFSVGCLRDIASFCEEATLARRKP
jgi:hypothetical protein